MLARIADLLGFKPRTPSAPPGGFLFASGASAPADGTAGYAGGCLFQRCSGNGANTSLYVNEGSATSCDFNAK